MSNMTVRPINEELENEETDLFDPLSRVVEMGLEMGSEVGLGNIFYNGILIQWKFLIRKNVLFYNIFLNT